MRRGNLLKLREPRWFTVPGSDLKIQLVPIGPVNFNNLIAGVLDEDSSRNICTKLFIDFENYFGENGDKVQNTLEARMELLEFRAIRFAIWNQANEWESEALQGEPVAASD